jgi:hypothetical protein
MSYLSQTLVIIAPDGRPVAIAFQGTRMLPPSFDKCKGYDAHKGKKLACGRRADYDARLMT